MSIFSRSSGSSPKNAVRPYRIGSQFFFVALQKGLFRVGKVLIRGMP